MKKLILIAIVLPLLFSCSKNEGCNDPKAFNYTIEADFDDGSCTYSKVVFYADSAQYPGTPIQSIRILINNSGAGTFNSASYGISDCTSPGDETVTYSLPSTFQVEWTAEVSLTDGSSYNNSGTVVSDLGLPCILINCLE